MIHHNDQPCDRRILVVDDNPVNQKLLSIHLKRRGFDVTCVENGEKAVAAHLAAPYDAVFMDVQMPVMDGLTATKLIRKQETAEGQPATLIVGVTAGIDEDTCLGAGMDAYLDKPVRTEELRSLLQERLN